MKFKMTPNKLMIGLFAVVITVLPIVTLLLPKVESSENENRTLAKFPSLVDQKKLDKAENLGDVIEAVKWNYITERKDPSFMDDFETYFSDHLAGRESWVKMSNTLMKMAGKQEINGTYTVDNRIIQAFKEYDSAEVDKALASIDDFAKRFPDIPMSIMIAPTSQEFYSNKIPSYAGLLSERAFIEDCYGKLENVDTIDAVSYISGHKDEYIYYRTDHHWTSLGAYYAYTSAGKSLGYSAYGLNAFNIETVSNNFRGTLFSKTLDDSITPDTIDYYFLANGEPKVKMTRFDGTKTEELDSLYVRDYLNVKDKYSSFTGSNVPVVTIETDVDNGKSLLMIKDSYAHSLVPFLSKHFSKITMVDMRYINTDLRSFVDLESYDRVMFMYNAITFAEDSNARKLVLTK